jgi:hypothetical protein
MSAAWRANSSLYIPSQSMGAADDEETFCNGDAVPLTTAAAATALVVLLAAPSVQWEQPG